ncbi:transcriptional regulator [Candidatus Bathyarchaeota archaeon]|nr:transcriptional regulator [Candidatus Bathyarchaeota archaeon]
MSKDQILGALILALCLLVAVGYIAVLAFPRILAGPLNLNEGDVRFWAVAIIVLIAFLAIMFIGAWIGWTIATTPPPKPIEEIEKEIEEESKPEKTEETEESGQ